MGVMSRICFREMSAVEVCDSVAFSPEGVVSKSESPFRRGFIRMFRVVRKVRRDNSYVSFPEFPECPLRDPPGRIHVDGVSEQME